MVLTDTNGGIIMNDGLSAADVMALTNNRNDPALTAALMDRRDDDNLWQNPFIYLVWIWAFSMFSGNGSWGNAGGQTAALQGALTRSDLFEGFNNQDVNSQLRGITNGICDGFYSVNNSMKDGFYGNQAAVKDGFYATQSALAENRYAQQNCCLSFRAA